MTTRPNALVVPFRTALDAPMAGPAWRNELRRIGRDAYLKTGVPHAKIEAWKYTNLNALVGVDFQAAPDAGSAPKALLDSVPTIEGAYRLVFVNGRLDDKASDRVAANGVTVGTLDAPSTHLGRVIDTPHKPFASLNAALWDDGLAIHVAAGTTLERPIHAVFLTVAGKKPAMTAPRTLVVVEKGATATLIETHVSIGAAPSFAAGVVEIVVEDTASFGHYRLIDERTDSFHIAATAARLGRASRYDSFTLTLGGRLVRSEIDVTLTSPDADCRINGAYLGVGVSHVDNTTVIDHVAPSCTSREVFRGIVSGKGRAVFQGKIIVRKGAVKTDGHQLHNALLLDAGAEVDSKPELEIYADDVKCSHGSTTGDLDAAALFYLAARGIAEPEARRLLIEGFLTEVVDKIDSVPTRDAFRAALVARLTAGARS